MSRGASATRWDALDRCALSKRRDGETVEDAHDRLAEAGDQEYCRLYEVTTVSLR